METCSKKHNDVKEKLILITEEYDSLKEIEKRLKKEKIAYEKWPLASGIQLAVFTGNSSYDIVGCVIKENKGNISIEDIYT